MLEKDIPYTKRGLSSVIPSIYEINGEIEPYILRGKVILSKTWAYEKPAEAPESNIDDSSEIASMATFEKFDSSPLAETRANSETKSDYKALANSANINDSSEISLQISLPKY